MGAPPRLAQLFWPKFKPTSSIIEVGAGNDYGHPTQATLNALQKYRLKDLQDGYQRQRRNNYRWADLSVSTSKQSRNKASTAPKATASASALPAKGGCLVPGLF